MKKTIMPTLYFSHGSPNTIMNNKSKAFNYWKKEAIKYIPEKPKGIICISAHWMTNREVRITASEKPETIHDFGGFERELYEMTYNSPGDPVLAKTVQTLLQNNGVKAELDKYRGYDHGAWTILKSIYPKADIPVVQVSLSSKDDETNFKIGQAIKNLKKEGILIVCSGGIIHNLGMTFQYFRVRDPKPEPWAIKFQNTIKDIVQKPYKQMVEDIMNCRKIVDYKLAVPSNEHFLPVIVAMGSIIDEESKGKVLFDDMEYGILSMEVFLFE
eukprot:gene1732-501_t